MLEQGKILTNEVLSGDYRRVRFQAPGICPLVEPGQFVHVRISERSDYVLRRPFSICDVSKDGIMSIVYKVVGAGTTLLANRNPGESCSLMGPLGTPYRIPDKDETPVIVAGGYGAAATYLLAQRCPSPGILLLGARGRDDLLMLDEFQACGFDIRVATDDGSVGERGLVTELLPDVFGDSTVHNPRFYGCGPHPMLMAMGRILTDRGLNGELSLDHRMCCGVGACYACVVKVKADGGKPWRYARTCREGPVFKAKQIYYGD